MLFNFMKGFLFFAGLISFLLIFNFIFWKYAEDFPVLFPM